MSRKGKGRASDWPLSLPAELLPVVARAVAANHDDPTLTRIQRVDKASYGLATRLLYRELRLHTPEQLLHLSELFVELPDGFVVGQFAGERVNGSNARSWHPERQRRVRRAFGKVRSVVLSHDVFEEGAQDPTALLRFPHTLFPRLERMRITSVQGDVHRYMSNKASEWAEWVFATFPCEDLCIEWIPTYDDITEKDRHQWANDQYTDTLRPLLETLWSERRTRFRRVTIETPIVHSGLLLDALYEWTRHFDMRLVTPFPAADGTLGSIVTRESIMLGLAHFARAYQDDRIPNELHTRNIKICDTPRAEGSEEQAVARRDALQRHAVGAGRGLMAAIGVAVDELSNDELLGPVIFLTASEAAS